MSNEQRNDQHMADGAKTISMATPLTKRELKKAARLFTLMTIGQFDCGGVETDEEIDVLSEAAITANNALLKEYPEIEGYLGSIRSCIDYIKGMRK